MSKCLQAAAGELWMVVRLWVILVGIGVAGMSSGGCAKLIDAPFDSVLVVDNGLREGGAAGGTLAASCLSRSAECGEFFDEAIGVTFQCGGCASNERCVANKCVCDTTSCEELGAECGYQNNGCSQLLSCGKCEVLYLNDPTKAYCGTDGKCGPAPVLPTTCEEVRDLGQPAECGTVGVGDTTLDCGECPGREQCINNRCEGYEPLTCEELTGGGLLCGTFPNGAGGEITCACGAGERCAAGNVCCTPRTECPTNGCDVISDGCGGTIDCGGCGVGETCLENVCCGGTPQCPVGVCGPQVVVCGQVLDCGCGAGECCVDDEDGAGVCHAPACPSNGSCGSNMDDGCGGTIASCGCPDGHVCNSEGMCECVPRACPTEDGACGEAVDDGCGGVMNCHECPKENAQTCFDGQCCVPLGCPADGSCGLLDNGCGGQQTCNCATGEACVGGTCMTPECPTGADCGINVVAGVALSCRGACANGEACVERLDGIYACGACSAACPTGGACGLVDVGCTVLSCDGDCGADGQSCVNRKVGDGFDNYTCCTPSCPNVEEATCGDNVDPACGGQVASCPGTCPTGQRCVLGDDDRYECVIPTCPDSPVCGENVAIPEGTIQCPGSCQSENETCTAGVSAYTCVCQVDLDPCGNSCGILASDGCGRQYQCTCPASEGCVDGSCCTPDSDRMVCEAANAACGNVTDPKCGIRVTCGQCTGEQVCTDHQCVCDPTKCEANESCDAATQTCKCDSAKCGAGQSCTPQGTCTCDSSKCPDGKVCNGQGMCACPQSTVEACAGAVCGAAQNECGDTVDCGSCPTSKSCEDGQCVCNETSAEACAGIECGSTSNDCAEPVSCPNTCNAATEQCSGNQCVCKESAAAACQRLGYECGAASNNCSEPITCPSQCLNGESCVSNHCQCDQTPTEACQEQELCGDVSGLDKSDSCGNPLTNCGACAGVYTCSANQCVCSEQPGEACERLNLCGDVTALGETDICGQPLANCGGCGPNELCQDNECVCQETTCGNRICGTVARICTSGTLPCGTCDGTCSPDGLVCTPPTPPADGGT